MGLHKFMASINDHTDFKISKVEEKFGEQKFRVIISRYKNNASRDTIFFKTIFAQNFDFVLGHYHARPVPRQR